MMGHLTCSWLRPARLAAATPGPQSRGPSSESPPSAFVALSASWITPTLRHLETAAEIEIRNRLHQFL